MRSEGYCSRPVCVCLSVKSHLTSGARVHPEVTYCADNEDQKNVEFSLKTLGSEVKVLSLLLVHNVPRSRSLALLVNNRAFQTSWKS